MKNRNFNWRPNWLTATLGAAIGLVVAGVVMLAPVTVLAVHDAAYGNFELEGNPTDDPGITGDDWDSVFDIPLFSGTAAQPVYNPTREKAEAGDQETFVYDDGSYSETDFGFSGQSNKDIQDVNAWLYDNARVTPDKDNISHAYAKAYRVQVNGTGPAHLVIDFGADRLANNGDAALGFWFFQDDVSRGPANRRGVGGFTGEHVDDDILVQVDFIQGGTRANKIQIFKWRGDGLGSHGNLDQLAYADGSGDAVCIGDDGNFPALADSACAKTNSVAWPSPWAFNPKSGPSGIFGLQSFFEGGIDITALLGHEVCFSSFMAETRTSHSETAELKDFALGEFELCSVDLVRKTCAARTDIVYELGDEDGDGIPGEVISSTPISPVYLPSTNTFQTEHVIQIRNDGFGVIFDLALQENAVTTVDANSTTGSSCKITAISGSGVDPVTVPSGGIQMPVPVLNNASTADDGWIAIAGALSNVAGQDTMSVTVRCISPANPFANSVTVRAAALTGLDATITDAYAEVDTQVGDGPPSDIRPQCEKSPSAAMSISKSCPYAVVLEADGNGIQRPKVCVDIRIRNTGEQYIDLISVTDNHDDGTSASLISLFQAALEPGYDKTIKECYYPKSADAANTDPDTAKYSDTVTASARARRTPGIPIPGLTSTAECPLCPSGLNGP